LAGRRAGGRAAGSVASAGQCRGHLDGQLVGLVRLVRLRPAGRYSHRAAVHRGRFGSGLAPGPPVRPGHPRSTTLATRPGSTARSATRPPSTHPLSTGRVRASSAPCHGCVTVMVVSRSRRRSRRREVENRDMRPTTHARSAPIAVRAERATHDPSRPRDRLYTVVTPVLAVLLLPSAVVRHPDRAGRVHAACRTSAR
jgi:hypothetical protein